MSEFELVGAGVVGKPDTLTAPPPNLSQVN